jgi:hypothetical protein
MQFVLAQLHQPPLTLHSSLNAGPQISDLIPSSMGILRTPSLCSYVHLTEIERGQLVLGPSPSTPRTLHSSVNPAYQTHLPRVYRSI